MTARELILRTARMRVTTWRATDTDDLAPLHADPDVMAEMTSGVQTADQTRSRIEAWIEEHTVRGWSKWRVTDHHDRLLGRAGFGDSHRTGHREIGYLLRRDVWGQGLATELVTALVDWHQQHPDQAMSATLDGYAYDTNTASHHVLRTGGFSLVGHDPRDPRQLLFTHLPGRPAEG